MKHKLTIYSWATKDCYQEYRY